MLLQVWTRYVAGYAKDAIVGACHRTSHGQEHKIIWRTIPERDTIFHLCVTACREQSSYCCDERLAWVASRCNEDYKPSSTDSLFTCIISSPFIPLVTSNTKFICVLFQRSCIVSSSYSSNIYCHLIFHVYS